MKRLFCFFVRLVFELTFCYFAVPSAKAQIQQAWVAHYSNGVTNGQHQALKMALGADGNIYVCGFSQNFNSNLDYAILKYGPSGNLLWAARYDSTNAPQAEPAGFALDSSNHALVTGNAGTAKFDATGSRVWWQPYSGTSIAVDSNANIIVAGFGGSFNTAKLSPEGTNLWTQTYSDVGPTVSQSVVLDSVGNCYISGLDVYYQYRFVQNQQLLVIKYSANGSLLWKFTDSLGGGFENVTAIDASASDVSSDLYVLFESNNNGGYMLDKVSPTGDLAWQLWNPTGNGASSSRGLALGVNGLAVITGHTYTSASAFGTYGILPSGTCGWSNLYLASLPNVPSSALGVVPNAGTYYVTGFSPFPNAGNDIVTIAYDTNGKQLWLQRYDGPAHGDDEGNAICVDTNGNVYVAGYDTPIGGGTEMVLIKYSPITVHHEANGDFQLEAQGAPSEPFDIQASTNLDTWLDLGDFDADTNGLLQFTDTNASQYNSRFYQAIPQ